MLMGSIFMTLISILLVVTKVSSNKLTDLAELNFA